MISVLAQRLTQPELLDSLPVNDPRAIASRRDLVRVNAVMFQGVIMARLLQAHLQRKPLHILEIGAGDGSFMLSVARRLARQWNDVDLVMLDQADLITPARRAQFAALGWRVQTVTSDVFDWIDRPEIGGFDVVTANLFLHHFHETELRKLLAVLPRLTTLFVATEPRRSRVALWCTGWLRVIGANNVTLHDAAASVRAGFSSSELSQLWPRGTAMDLHERRIGPFTHIFLAGGIRRKQ
jgi:2-polyprenyl-3-methyl-5-hydroxy-6-metoxy-1,4-benzoquinol methylase